MKQNYPGKTKERKQRRLAMLLKMTPLLFSIVIIAYLISNCKNSPMDVVNKGQLQMRISFAEEINKASTIRVSDHIDWMRVMIFGSDDAVIVSSDLMQTQNGTKWEGKFGLDPIHNPYRVTVDAGNSELNYAGSSSGVNVEAGKDKPVVISLLIQPPAIFNIQLSPDHPATLGLNDSVKITFDYYYTTPETGGVQISGFPYNNGSLIPNYDFSPSPLYPVGNGSGTTSFWITSGDATVDLIHLKMRNADLSEVLKLVLLPVAYNFSP